MSGASTNIMPEQEAVNIITTAAGTTDGSITSFQFTLLKGFFYSKLKKTVNDIKHK